MQCSSLTINLKIPDRLNVVYDYLIYIDLTILSISVTKPSGGPVVWKNEIYLYSDWGSASRDARRDHASWNHNNAYCGDPGCVCLAGPCGSPDMVEKPPWWFCVCLPRLIPQPCHLTRYCSSSPRLLEFRILSTSCMAPSRLGAITVSEDSCCRAKAGWR